MGVRRVCSQCWRLVPCPEHQHARRRFQKGPTAYNTKRWLLLRNAFRVEHPECVNAGLGITGCTLVTEVVDHIIPHRGDETLMFARANLQAMCWSCHSRKTIAEVRR
jgi:5-methylcytosine-specific restriction protein A